MERQAEGGLTLKWVRENQAYFQTLEDGDPPWRSERKTLLLWRVVFCIYSYQREGIIHMDDLTAHLFQGFYHACPAFSTSSSVATQS